VIISWFALEKWSAVKGTVLYCTPYICMRRSNHGSSSASAACDAMSPLPLLPAAPATSFGSWTYDVTMRRDIIH
jgi:hypothetical protein